VRELENVIERTVALEPLEIMSSGSLPGHLAGARAEPSPANVAISEEGIDLEEYLNGIRSALMRQALERSGGNQKDAAGLLRLSYRAFRYHADKLGITHEEE
jgi:DNA-binding NtrC family response regulator